MDADEFIDELNSLAGSTGGDMSMIADDVTASVERRLAALLCDLMLADHPLAVTATDIMVQLTCPASERPRIDPRETPFATAIKRLLPLETDKIQQVIDDPTAGHLSAIAAQLILAVRADEPFDNQAADQILRLTTGQDLNWWARWIRERLNP